MTARAGMLAGGRGTWERNADGSWTVRDLAGRAVVTVPASALPPEMVESVTRATLDNRE